MFYDDEILNIVQAIENKFGLLGWSVDMIIDYGSHSLGEARSDSDYDINIYVHKDGWLYLFNEYAENLKNQNNDVTNWHNYIRSQLVGYQELSSELEKHAREIVDSITTRAIYITNIFDTRLLLYNMMHETWEIFSMVQGSPINSPDIYNELIEFMKQTKPFYKHFYDTHLYYCKLSEENAVAALLRITGGEAKQYRKIWLSSTATYLRRSISLLSLLIEGWFIKDKDIIIKFIQKHFPENIVLISNIYELKSNKQKYKLFIESGFLAHTEISILHERCLNFGNIIISEIDKMISNADLVNISYYVSLNKNKADYKKLSIYRNLFEE